MGTVDVVIGKVIGVHIKDEVITNGKIDVAKTQPIARCGYYDYAVIRETFEMLNPGPPEIRFGMEGNVAKHKAFAEVSRLCVKNRRPLITNAGTHQANGTH